MLNYVLFARETKRETRNNFKRKPNKVTAVVKRKSQTPQNQNLFLKDRNSIQLNFDKIDQIIFCVISLHRETSFALSVTVERSWQNVGFIQQFSENRNLLLISSGFNE